MQAHVKHRPEIHHYYWHVQAYILVQLSVINHSRGLVEPGLSEQWISLLRLVLGCFSGLIHHIRAWESWSGPLTSLSPRG